MVVTSVMDKENIFEPEHQNYVLVLYTVAIMYVHEYSSLCCLHVDTASRPLRVIDNLTCITNISLHRKNEVINKNTYNYYKKNRFS